MSTIGIQFKILFFFSDPPKFVRIDLSDQNTIIAKSGNPTTYTFNETVNVTMTLNIESNPDAQLHLNSSLLKIDRLNYTKKAQNYTSKLPSLKCENSGIFQIQASNGILNGETRTINLTIYCKYSNLISCSLLPRNRNAHTYCLGNRAICLV